jgi:hypothetical protein
MSNSFALPLLNIFGGYARCCNNEISPSASAHYAKISGCEIMHDEMVLPSNISMMERLALT